nr:hypothetical protein [Tanacetum cinerariifolium]
MSTTIEKQVALDEALVPNTQRIMESTIKQQTALDESLVPTKLYHTSIRFKIDTKKSVLNMEAFREMLHVSPRLPNQPFADLPTEEEVLEFLRFLGHSQDIRYLSDNQHRLCLPDLGGHCVSCGTQGSKAKQ